MVKATEDARRGDGETIRFLNVTCPDLQELATPRGIQRTGSAPLQSSTPLCARLYLERKLGRSTRFYAHRYNRPSGAIIQG
jgi:hypothetical protein